MVGNCWTTCSHLGELLRILATSAKLSNLPLFKKDYKNFNDVSFILCNSNANYTWKGSVDDDDGYDGCYGYHCSSINLLVVFVVAVVYDQKMILAKILEM